MLLMYLQYIISRSLHDLLCGTPFKLRMSACYWNLSRLYVTLNAHIVESDFFKRNNGLNLGFTDMLGTQGPVSDPTDLRPSRLQNGGRGQPCRFSLCQATPFTVIVLHRLWLALS